MLASAGVYTGTVGTRIYLGIQVHTVCTVRTVQVGTAP